MHSSHTMYSVETNSHVVAVVYRSTIDADVARDSKADLLTYVETEEKKFRFLLDFTDASGLTDEAKDELVMLARRIKEGTDRMAVVCSGTLRMPLIQIFEGQSGLSTVRIFSAKDEALGWLHEGLAHD